jgi:hypothetical protein
MAFSSFGSIHSMLGKKSGEAPKFTGSVVMLSMAGTTTSSISTTWMSVNGTGNYLIATSYSTGNGRNYLSTDAGVTWTKLSTPIGDGANFRQAWVSRNGVYRVYSVNQPTSLGYSSSDSGSTYATVSNANLQGAFVSDDGNVKVLSIYGGAIYRIYNSPTTNAFSATVSTNLTQRGQLKGSANGQYLMNQSSSNGMQFSSNYGATWSTLVGVSGLTGSSNTNMADMAISGDGQYMIVTGAGYKVWKTSDFGATWTTISGTGGLPNTSIYTSTTNTWACCTASKTGQYMSIAGYFNQAGGSFSTGGWLFISSDYGVTWTSKSIPLTNTATDPAFLTSTMSYTDAGSPNRIFIPTYSQGIYYING